MKRPKSRKPVRITLTAKQASSGIGFELVELAKKLGEDGILDVAELFELKDWLRENSDDELPAIKFLNEAIVKNGLNKSIDPEKEKALLNKPDLVKYEEKEIVEEIEPGVISVLYDLNKPQFWKGHEYELNKVLKAILRVVPKKERDYLKEKMDEVLDLKEQTFKPIRDEWRRNKYWKTQRPNWVKKRSDHFCEWEYEPASERQIDILRSLGAKISRDREFELSRLEAHDWLTRLLDKKYSPRPSGNESKQLRTASNNHSTISRDVFRFLGVLIIIGLAVLIILYL